MTRDRDSETTDSIVSEREPARQQYRLFAVEPHGWSSFMLEDQEGRVYLGSATAGTLISVRQEDVERMLRTRAYRRWNGDRAWTSLDRLPLVAWAFSQFVPPQNEAGAEAAF